MIHQGFTGDIARLLERLAADVHQQFCDCFDFVFFDMPFDENLNCRIPLHLNKALTIDADYPEKILILLN